MSYPFINEHERMYRYKQIEEGFERKHHFQPWPKHSYIVENPPWNIEPGLFGKYQWAKRIQIYEAAHPQNASYTNEEIERPDQKGFG